jgi:hypothetical protein
MMVLCFVILPTHSHRTEILSGKKVPRLEFENYEKKIVEKLGIVIEGWTCPDFISPSHFKKVSQVEELYHAVNSGACKARKLTDLELAERKASNQARPPVPHTFDTVNGIGVAGESNSVIAKYSLYGPPTRIPQTEPSALAENSNLIRWIYVHVPRRPE